MQPLYRVTPETRAERYASRTELGVTAQEYAILRQLNRPAKIQTFLDAIPANREIGGETILSVREVLRQRCAHCIEGALSPLARCGAKGTYH